MVIAGYVLGPFLVLPVPVGQGLVWRVCCDIVVCSPAPSARRAALEVVAVSGELGAYFMRPAPKGRSGPADGCAEERESPKKTVVFEKKIPHGSVVEMACLKLSLISKARRGWAEAGGGREKVRRGGKPKQNNS